MKINKKQKAESYGLCLLLFLKKGLFLPWKLCYNTFLWGRKPCFTYRVRKVEVTLEDNKKQMMEIVGKIIEDAKKNNNVLEEEIIQKKLKSFSLSREQYGAIVEYIEGNDIIVLKKEEQLLEKPEDNFEDVEIDMSEDMAATIQDVALNVDDPVRAYLKEIGRYQLLSPEEEQSLAKKIQDGDAAAKELFINKSAKAELHTNKNFSIPLAE